ncbi:FoF1 ATP synthase subunit delta/epsilon [Mycoplasma simbae]|uniref:FoF1 ATP synthase subunit delta/epsilon n=1 Tax=Mycoplasma simbae TaxID=36744 RepID=UPI000496F0A1|nr:hypothetical protein [Mycoplasma simbae]
MKSTNSINLFITTPTGIFFDGPVQQVTLSTIAGGAITLMLNHVPFMSNIAVGKLLINSASDPEHKTCAIGGGLVFTDGKEIKIITDDIVYDKDIVLAWALDQRDHALAQMKSADSIDYVKYELQLRKAISKIDIYNNRK